MAIHSEIQGDMSGTRNSINKSETNLDGREDGIVKIGEAQVSTRNEVRMCNMNDMHTSCSDGKIASHLQANGKRTEDSNFLRQSKKSLLPPRVWPPVGSKQDLHHLSSESKNRSYCNDIK